MDELIDAYQRMARQLPSHVESTLLPLESTYQLDTLNNTSDKSNIDRLKDKIKDLKKRISKEKNYMSKKNLQQELQRTQKEYKKEKEKVLREARL